MYQNRHCNYQDYERFNLLSNEFFSSLSKRDNMVIYNLEKLVEEANNYDIIIGEKMNEYLLEANKLINNNELESAFNLLKTEINKLVEELKKNILVDINEHSL